LNGNVAFLLPFLIDLLIVYPTVKKKFNLRKKFPEKTYFFITKFFKVIRKTKKKISAEIFFKTLIDLSLDLFQKLCVTFSFGCFQTFWHSCLVVLKKTNECNNITPIKCHSTNHHPRCYRLLFITAITVR
jgi:hypothetical protein